MTFKQKIVVRIMLTAAKYISTAFLDRELGKDIDSIIAAIQNEPSEAK